MLDHIQVIKEDNQAKFAVIPYDEFLYLKELLNDEEKLVDYLNYLHMKKVKSRSEERSPLDEVWQALSVD